MSTQVLEAKRKADELYDILAKLLSTDPAELPRMACESNLRCAWYEVLACNESLNAALRQLDRASVDSTLNSAGWPKNARRMPHAR